MGDVGPREMFKCGRMWLRPRSFSVRVVEINVVEIRRMCGVLDPSISRRKSASKGRSALTPGTVATRGWDAPSIQISYFSLRLMRRFGFGVVEGSSVLRVRPLP